MRGRIRVGPWLAFDAVQEFAGHEFTWRAEADDRIVATFDVPPERVELRLGIDAAGALRSVSLPRWGDVGARATATSRSAGASRRSGASGTSSCPAASSWAGGSARRGTARSSTRGSCAPMRPGDDARLRVGAVRGARARPWRPCCGCWASSPLDPEDDHGLLERLTELALVVAVFSAGLTIERHVERRSWWSIGLLLTVVMPLTIAAIALFGTSVMGLSFGAALLLGAVLAPTDPVLAGEVGLSAPGGEVLGEPRLSLHTEAGFNDGLASPFVVLGLLAADEGGTDWLGRWLAVDLLYGAGAGLALGAGAGLAAAALLTRARARGLVAGRTGGPRDRRRDARAVRRGRGDRRLRAARGVRRRVHVPALRVRPRDAPAGPPRRRGRRRGARAPRARHARHDADRRGPARAGRRGLAARAPAAPRHPPRARLRDRGPRLHGPPQRPVPRLLRRARRGRALLRGGGRGRRRARAARAARRGVDDDRVRRRLDRRARPDRRRR